MAGAADANNTAVAAAVAMSFFILFSFDRGRPTAV
jgi:hypothetical protein